jgi:RNA polymerase sigma-70 factor, ECF subfamily
MGAYTTTVPLGDAHSRSLTRRYETESPEAPNPEAALVQAAQRGDKAAFSQLVELHQGAIYGYLCARLSDATQAEDLCQDVFLRCYLGREKFERAVAVRPWLIGIARNLLREHARRLHRRREVAWTELCLELETIGMVDEHTDEALTHLPKCLESLGKSAREALQLKYHARMKLQEIGKKLCRSEGAVKLLMFRARQALRNCLDRKMKPADE